MSTTVQALFTYRVKPGCEEQFQSYIDKVFPVTEANEPYVVGYEIFQNADGIYLQHETYENEDAIWKHMNVTASGQADFAASTELLSVQMLGSVSDKFRETYGHPEVFGDFKRVTR
ncbi:MAG: hypothetical protein C0482_22275 [Gordonia sp.]|nr:hypothetical protein [Gordonia sp. (in: high G+C Gram-positive bacteria)]